MKYNNSIYRTDNHRGIKLVIKADDLLSLEQMMRHTFRNLQEQLKKPYSSNSRLSTREVLQMKDT